MIEGLVDYGSLGIFISYLIYDKQVWSKKMIGAIEKLTEKIK